MRIARHLVRLLGEFLGFAWRDRAWWIVPIVIMLLVLTAFVVAGSIVAPFLYPLF